MAEVGTVKNGWHSCNRKATGKRFETVDGKFVAYCPNHESRAGNPKYTGVVRRIWGN